MYLVTEIRNQLCLEDDSFSATDSYMAFQDIYNHCLEGDIFMAPPIGFIPWNKGKTGVYSETVLKKNREAHKGNKNHLNKKHNEYTKIKMSLAALGRKMPAPTRLKISAAEKNKHNSISTEFVSGNKHPNWKGGISYLPYCPKFNYTLKKQIRKRDNYICQFCGVKENGEKLAVHHIHYDKENCKPDLVSLCHNCHSKVNHNREYYENLFMKLLIKRGMIL